MKRYGILVYNDDSKTFTMGSLIGVSNCFGFTENKTTALKELQRLSKDNPGSTLHLMETTTLAQTPMGTPELLRVNDKGEVLPA